MSTPHLGHDFKLYPHSTHPAKCPQGTNANARCLVEHTIHRLVAVVTDNPLLDALDDVILM